MLRLSGLHVAGILAVLLAIGCSPEGENSAPTRALEVGAFFDISAAELVIREEGNNCSWGQPQGEVRAGGGVKLCKRLCNIGVGEIPEGAVLWRLDLNGTKIEGINLDLARGQPNALLGNSPLLPPGTCEETVYPQYQRLKKPGEHKLQWKVWLLPRLGETNLGNNEFTQVVTVKEQ